MDEYIVSVILWITTLVLFIILFAKNSELKQKIWQMDQKINDLSKELGFLKEKKKTAAIKTKKEDEPDKILIGKDPVSETKKQNSHKKTKTSLVQENPSVWKTRFSEFEKLFMENYTGLLGGAIFILGVIFLAIFGALKMSASGRFSLLIAAVFFLYILSFLMKQKKIFEGSAIWIRSAGAALLLFTFYGAGHILGLKILESTTMIYSFLTFGILFVLISGYLSQSMTIFTLHYAYTLLGLAATKESLITFIIVVITTFFGFITIPRLKADHREKWVLPLFTAGGLIYLFSWYLNIPEALERQGLAMWIILTVSAWVSFSPVLWLNKLRSMASVNTARALAWTSMMTVMILSSENIDRSAGFYASWGGFVFLASASFLTIITMKKNKSQDDTNRIIDYIFLFVFLALAIFQYNNPKLNDPFRYLMLITITSFFILPIKDIPEKHRKSALYFTNLLTWIRFLSSFLFLLLMADEIKASPVHILLSYAATGVVVFGAYMRNQSGLKEKKSIFSNWIVLDKFSAYFSFDVFSVGFILYSLLFISSGVWVTCFSVLIALLALGIAQIFLIKRQKFDFFIPASIGASLLFILPTIWVYFFNDYQMNEIIGTGILYLIPLFIFFYFSIKKNTMNPGLIFFIAVLHSVMIILSSSNGHITSLWLLLLFTFIIIIGTLIHAKRSEIKTGINGIIAALYLPLAFYILNRIFDDSHLYSEWTGLLYALFIFIAYHITSVIGKLSSQGSRMKEFLHESAFIVLISTILLDLHEDYYAVAFALMTILAYITGTFYSASARFKEYSLFFHIVSVTFVLFSGEHDTTAAGFALGIQIIYLVLFHKTGGIGQGKGGQTHYSLLTKWQYTIVYYTFFFSLGIYIWMHMENTLLTLLWAGEAFFIFILGLFLKETHFRYIASSIFLFCIFRLVIWDLSESGTLMRAIVFLGTGTLLLIMNVLYQKFKTYVP